MSAYLYKLPKFCLSTMAANDLSRQMGSKDITLMPSIVDVADINSISNRLIKQAAAAISAMAAVPIQENNAVCGRIAISMFGNTTACVDKCTELLKKEDMKYLLFMLQELEAKQWNH
jgi:uncharacterized protein (UPF0261 family)